MTLPRVGESLLPDLLDADLALMTDGLPRWVWDRALLDPLREFLSRPSKGLRGRLVEAAWHAAGGAPEGPPVVLPLLTEILHAGSLIVDDIEDGSRERRGSRALHELVGIPTALNAGNLLYFWAQRLIARMALPEPARVSLYEAVTGTLLDCHRGQALDLSVRVYELGVREVGDVVRVTTRLKTGSLMAFAARSGAVAAGARPPVVHALGLFGERVGLTVQMLDDLSGILNPRRHDKGTEDLRLARPTWVWAWLAELLEPGMYRSMMRRLAGIVRGDCPEPLRSALRDHLAVAGPARARACLARAAADLERQLPRASAVLAFQREMETLEAAYAG